MSRIATVLIAAVFYSCVSVPAQLSPRPASTPKAANPAPSLARQYFDRHFEGLHPSPRAEYGNARAGSGLLETRAKRAQAAAARLRATAVAAPTASAIPADLPGLATRAPLGAGSVPMAIATGDFNRDGRLDFAVANGASNDIWLYFGNGDNTFQVPRIVPLKRGVGPQSIAAADLRKSGILDLVVAEIDTGTVGVLLGNGDGTFANEVLYTVPQAAAAVTINDFNHDGRPDILVGLAGRQQQVPAPALAMLPGNGDGSFGQPLVSYSNNVFWNSSAQVTVDSADVNNDGNPDVILLQPLYQATQGVLFDNVIIYTNNGDGTFTGGAPIVHADALSYPTDARLADVDGDGCVDALVSDLSEAVFVLPGDCSGHFQNLKIVAVGGPATTVRVADVNGDGHPDLITGSAMVQQVDYTYPAGTTIGVALGDGKGNFSHAQVLVGNSEESAIAIGDFSGNGRPSIASADVDTDTVTLFANKGNADFGTPYGYYVGKGMYGDINAVGGFTFADLNGDGIIDMFGLGGGDAFYSMTSLNDGKGHFAPSINSSFGNAASQAFMGDYRLGDFRNTGHLDVVGIGVSDAYTTAGHFIWFQPSNGDGSFGTATQTATPGADGTMSIGDFNGDGKLDFVAVGGAQTHTLTPFLGNGNGTFRAGTPMSFTDQNVSISRVYTGDYNGDGKADVLVYATSNGYWAPFLTLWEFLGKGDGTFQPGKILSGNFQPFTMADVNNDHRADIVQYDTFWPDGTTQTFAPPRITTLTGQPDGTFTQSKSYSPYPNGSPIDLAPFLEFGDMTESAVAADYSGDGKVDVAALQEGHGRYVQFLAGNGDGSLLSTYDEFGFPFYQFPLWARDLNGDGRADAVAFDNGGGTALIFSGAPAPALQFILENSLIQGNSNCGDVFANVPSSSDRTVTLTSTTPGVVLPASVSLPANALGARFCYTLSDTYDQSRAHEISATLDGDTATTYASQAYTPPFGLALSAPQTDPIYQGRQTKPVTATISPQGNFNGTVKLSCGGLEAGFSCAFTPAQILVSPGVSSSARLVVQTANGWTGETPITLIADDGVNIVRQTLTLEIADLQASPQVPDPIFDMSPGINTSSFYVGGIPPYTFSCDGLPAGAACQITGDQLAFPQVSTMTATISLPAGISPGNSTFNVNVQSGGLAAHFSQPLAIFTFIIQPPAADKDWAPSPSSSPIYLPVQVENIVGAPASLGCTMDGLTVCQTTTQGINSGTTSISIYLNIPPGVTSGQHTLVVSGNVAGVPVTSSVPWWIADFTGSLATTSLSVKSGASASINGTLTGTAGFTSNVALSCASSTQYTCTFNAVSYGVNGAGSTPFTVNVFANATAAAHPIDHPGRRLPPTALALLAPAAMFLLAFRRRRRSWVSVFTGFLLMAGVTSCGSGGSTTSAGGTPPSQPPSTYNVTITAREFRFGILHDVGTVTVTVNH